MNLLKGKMMYKNLIKVILISLVFLTVNTRNTFAQIDSSAVAILDSMSNVVTGIESCSFVLKTEYDVYSSRLGLVKHSDIANVTMKAPDRLLMNRKGDKGQKDFYYNGKDFSYYSADNNQYATILAPSTIMETIENIHEEYGVEFPAADIFDEDLVDDILEKSDNLSYLGLTYIDDRECFHIAGTTDEITYQFWITNDDYLPLKIAIVYTNKEGKPQYEGQFLNWNLKPVSDDTMFNFVIPQGATKIIFKKKN
jgi:hypothetical protein